MSDDEYLTPPRSTDVNALLAQVIEATSRAFGMLTFIGMWLWSSHRTFVSNWVRRDNRAALDSRIAEYMPMRTSLTRVLSAMTLLMLSSSVVGDSPARPSTYQVVSADQKFVFTMVPPSSLNEELKTWNAIHGEKVREIRSVRGVSGMYRNDGSSEPLWTVSWYAFGTEIFSDGVHLVRHGPWASKVSDEAISFFAKDKLLRTYRVSDLVKDRGKLERSVSHFSWSIDTRLDDSMLRYTLLTVDHRCYVFDVTTGEILSRTSRRRLP